MLFHALIIALNRNTLNLSWIVVDSGKKPFKSIAHKTPVQPRLRNNLVYISIFLTLLMNAPPLSSADSKQSMANTKIATNMITAAKAFLNSLTPELHAKASIAFNSDERFNWKFFPARRKGVPLKELNDASVQAAHKLLQTALSHRGYQKTVNIIQLENVLRALEGSDYRDPGLYYLSFFGEPDLTGNWGWRFEGHHLSLNYTVVNGQAVAVTPNFWGANPATVLKGPHKGLRSLAHEEDIARTLLMSLSKQQRATAIFRDNAFRDIVTGTADQVEMLPIVGIAYQQLADEQRRLLMSLIMEYVNNMSADIAAMRIHAIQQSDLNKIYFAWAGGIEKHQPHYYRIQSETFLIEYDNIQNQANHIHAVWRDFDGDFGRDLLKEHYQTHAHKKNNQTRQTEPQ